MNAFFSRGGTFTNLPVYFSSRNLSFGSVTFFGLLASALALKLPLALLLQTLVDAHGFRVPRRCSGRFFGHRFSRSVAASLLSVGVLDGDLSVPEREHVAALDLNTNAIVPSA